MDTNWAQVLFNSIVTGSLYLISAVALTLAYGLSRFPNFAHAEFMVFGAFMGYFVSEQLNWSFPLAFIIAFILGGILGLLSYRGIFQPLKRRGSSLIHLMIASLALGYILRHTVGEIWGFSPLYYDVTWTVFEVGSVRMSAIWIYLIVTAIIIGILLHFLFIKTRLGKAIRATSNNPELAQSSGINTSQIILITWFLAAGLAALAGIFRAAGTRLTPFLGWDILLPTFAVTLLGGIGSFYGAIVAAYTIGLAENLGVVFLANAGLSTEYRMAIPFIIIIFILIFKPKGISMLFKGN